MLSPKITTYAEKYMYTFVQAIFFLQHNFFDCLTKVRPHQIRMTQNLCGKRKKMHKDACGACPHLSPLKKKLVLCT